MSVTPIYGAAPAEGRVQPGAFVFCGIKTLKPAQLCVSHCCVVELLAEIRVKE